MSNDDNNPLTDDRLEQMYRALPDDEPPVELDEKIRAAARDAVRAEPVHQVGPRRSWYRPVSMAAVVLVSLSVVISLVVDEQVLHKEMSPATDSTEKQPMTTFEATEAESEVLPVRPSQVPARDLPDDVLRLRESMKKQQVPGRSPRQSAPSQTVSPAIGEQGASRRHLEPSEHKSARQRPPVEQQLERLMHLLQSQQYDRLRGELETFHDRYPDQSLPDELKRWEKINMPAPAE